MSATGRTPAARYGQLVAVAAGVTAALAAVGFPATRRWGEEAVVAMLAACGISLAASAIGALPLVMGSDASPAGRLNRSLGAMLGRFVAALLLGAAAALSGWFANAPLLVWLAISYLVLLVVDTLFALRLAQGR